MISITLEIAFKKHFITDTSGEELYSLLGDMTIKGHF